MKFLKTTLLSGVICSLLISSMAYGNVPTSTPAKGMGANPPTQEEIDWANKNMSKNHPIRNNELAIKRINDELKAKGRPQINPNSAVPMGKEVSTQVDATAALASTAILPSFVDNSTLACFPPIGDQSGLGACVAFSTTYYQLTHMTGLVRNWDVKNDSSNTKKFSPRWTYNLGNRGANHGMSAYGAYRILLDNGAALWADFPYDSIDYKQWCLTSDSWTNAAKYRADQEGDLRISDSSNQSDNATPVTSPTDPDLSLVKNYLNNGYILSFATYIDSWQFTTIKNDPNTTADNDFVGKYICYARATDTDYSGSHEMTVVGYNDNIWTDINNDGIVQECEKGAFKVANSWGADSDANMDNGFYWVAYDALNRVSAIDKFNNDHPNEKISPIPPVRVFNHRSVVFNNYGLGYENSEYNTLYWMTAKESYSPSLMAKFAVSHSKRSQMKVELGYSDINTTTPVATQEFGALTNAGGGFMYDYRTDVGVNNLDYSGDYAFDGTGDGTGNTICDGIFTLDFTDIIKKNIITPGNTKRWYLKITDGSTSPDDGKVATVKHFSLTDSSENLLASTGLINQTVNGGATTIYLDYALGASQSAWVNKTNAPVYRCNSASASYNNEIYVAGGYDGNCDIQNSLWSYNPATETWTEKAQMATPRTEAGAATVLNKLYVVGGLNGTSLNSIEEYNPSNNTWTTKTSMNTPRHFLGVAAANGKIYAIGGVNNDGTTLNTVEEYDPTTDTWTTKASMPTARDSFGIASYNGKIYVIGGGCSAANTICNTVEVYDPLNDTWETATSMPTAREELTCVEYNGKIYAIGGLQSGGVSDKTEVYDPSTNMWIILTNLNNARSILSAACANGKLYAIGGIDDCSNVSNKVEEYIP